MHEPSQPRLAMVKSRISPEAWQARVEAGHEGAAVLRAISGRVDAGASLDEAIRQEVPKSRRNWVIRNLAGFRREGFEALIDERVPREPKVAKESGPLIEAARGLPEAHPKVPVHCVQDAAPELRALR